MKLDTESSAWVDGNCVNACVHVCVCLDLCICVFVCRPPTKEDKHLGSFDPKSRDFQLCISSICADWQNQHKANGTTALLAYRTCVLQKNNLTMLTCASSTTIRNSQCWSARFCTGPFIQNTKKHIVSSYSYSFSFMCPGEISLSILLLYSSIVRTDILVVLLTLLTAHKIL